MLSEGNVTHKEERKQLRLALALVIALCLLAASFGLAQTNDVPRDHWAYEAVQDLANKGLILGYPDGNFFGNRTLTRYEFATVVKRILDNVDTKVATAQGAQPGTAQTAAPAGVSQADLDKINKLVDEFKVELTVIGTRLDKVEADMADVQKRLGTVEEITMGGEGAVESTKNDVAKLKKVSVSGYLQARFEQFPGDKDEDGKAINNTFNVRRARIKVTGKPTDTTTAVLQLDMGGNKPAVKDAYAEYAFNGSSDLGLAFTIGQMNWPFGYEVPYSSSKRETPERALWARRFFPGERDRGAKFSYPLMRKVGNQLLFQVGLFDGTGIETVNTVTTVVTDSTTTPPTTKKIKVPSTVSKDFDNNKDLIGNLQYYGENVEAGLSAYIGKGIWDPDRVALVQVLKTRYGADFRYYLNKLTLKSEYAIARGVDEAVTGFNNARWLNGYDVQLAYNISAPGTLVAKYEGLSLDPKFPAFGRRTAWNLGYIHWMDANSRLKLFYTLNQEEKGKIDNNIWRLEWLTTY